VQGGTLTAKNGGTINAVSAVLDGTSQAVTIAGDRLDG